MAINLDMNVLVVDDYDSMQRAVRRVLEAIGFDKKNIDLAGDVETAMSLLTGGMKKHGLIISDYRMKPQDGLDFLRRVRSTPALADIRFIMMSADNQLSLAARFKEAGSDAFLVKPFSPDTLRATLEQLF